MNEGVGKERLEHMKRDLAEILGAGITHTGTVMEMLKAKGWTSEDIVPVVYRLLLLNQLDPNGNKIPFKAN